jgi:hypothetical protein
MLASEIGLSTTTTSSGLLEDARIKPQVPSSTDDAHAVDRDQLADRLPGNLFAIGVHRLEAGHHLIDDTIFGLIGAIGLMVGEPQVRGRAR